MNVVKMWITYLSEISHAIKPESIMLQSRKTMAIVFQIHSIVYQSQSLLGSPDLICYNSYLKNKKNEHWMSITGQLPLITE